MTQTDTDFVSEPTSSTEAEPTPQPRRREIFLPAIFGGAVACALGFFAGQLDWVEARLGLGASEEMAQTIAEQQEMIADLRARIDALPEPETVDLSGLETGLSGLVAQTEQLEVARNEQVAALDTIAERLSTLEKRPLTQSVSPEAMQAYEDELNRLTGELKAAVDAQRSEVAEILNSARASEDQATRNAQVAQARAAAARIVAAVDNGEPFADAIEVLQSSGDFEVPAALTDAAAEGVPTLAALQSQFPQAARAALAAAREEAAAAGDGGVFSFLERRLGARSVVPQDGDDPDAVLSRAEAAVKSGDFGAALSEVNNLPDTAKSVLAPWTTQAQTRNGAVTAVRDFLSSLSAN